MARLTADTREKMARAIVKHAYGKQAEALVAKHVALFDRAYEFQYSGKLREAMDALLALEPEALPKRRSITVNVGLTVDLGTFMAFTPNMCGCLAETKGVQQFPLRQLPFLDCHNGWSHRLHIPDGDKRDPTLHQDIRQYADEFQKLKVECERAYAEAKAALDGFGTDKRLREGWPEVLPVIGTLIPSDERAGLPAVQVEKLNEKFGLPPEEVAA